MVISLKNRFVFIHTCKTGGSSIQLALRKAASSYQIDAFADVGISYHSTAAQIRTLLGGELFARLFSFAFVRNPWNLQYSLYRFMLRNTDHHRHAEIQACGSFEAYLEHEHRRIMDSRSRFPDRNDLQMAFVCDERGEQLPNFVGRFENLLHDFRRVLQALGLPEDTPLPHTNRSTINDYRQHYTPRLIDLVAEMHRPDIDFFRYTFDT